MSSVHGFGLGIATKNSLGEVLDVFYPTPVSNISGDLAQLVDGLSGELDSQTLSELAIAFQKMGAENLAATAHALTQSSKAVVAACMTENIAPVSVEDAYLKLHMLSHRLVQPHGTCLDGLFPLLHNIAWTDKGAIDLRELAQRQLDARLRGEVLEVASVDKFPKMTNYVVPTGVRIAHTARVRLGAYLGEGTTVMHEGFINFNAGAEGPGMIEGRISAGVWVGAG